MLELIEPFLVGGVVGIIVGVIVARYYFKSRIEMKNIGQVIEYAMVHKDSTRLRSMVTRLEMLVADIEGCSGDVMNRLELSKDIEENLMENEVEQESN